MPSSTSPSQIPSHPDIPPFPSPSTFSILPDIYLLIARLNILQNPGQPNSHQTHTQAPTHTQSQSQFQSQQLLSTPTPALSQATPTGTLAGGSNTQAAPPSTQSTTTRHIQTSGPPIDVKELPAHVYPIKQKLVKARAAVSALPDLDRSVEEQEIEIRQLEREVALLNGRLAKLGGIAGRSANAAAEDTDMLAVDR
ncbi:hypothetical protein LTR84_007628 [Exophiala bonariae]|uniref:Mediator of RNA polymerase II transcription subunit 9 n=1 Tax=Exophiala bonariae TaxID=1690606 RepID=A0AAV9NKL2_9EURO|nr:hypothetical protein LTR84_007628 [Exophiala bonariae]